MARHSPYSKQKMNGSIKKQKKSEMKLMTSNQMEENTKRGEEEAYTVRSTRNDTNGSVFFGTFLELSDCV